MSGGRQVTKFKAALRWHLFSLAIALGAFA